MIVKHYRWSVKYIDRRPDQGGQDLENEVGSQWEEMICKKDGIPGFRQTGATMTTSSLIEFCLKMTGRK